MLVKVLLGLNGMKILNKCNKEWQKPVFNLYCFAQLEQSNHWHFLGPHDQTPTCASNDQNLLFKPNPLRVELSCLHVDLLLKGQFRLVF